MRPVERLNGRRQSVLTKETGIPATPAPYNKVRVLTAAAAPVRLTSKSELEKIRQRNSMSHLWQAEAWRVYENIGEIRYAFNLVANTMSRIRLHAGVVVNPDEPPVEVKAATHISLSDGTNVGHMGGIDPRLAAKARSYVQALDKGQGMGALIKSYALNKQVAGEAYLACIDGKWSMRSNFELKVDPSGKMLLQPSLSTTALSPRLLPKGTPIARLWTPHPMYSMDPDCSLRPVLANCEELILLERMIRSTVRSRMNAGILAVASEIVEAANTPGAEGNFDDPGEVETEPFMTQLIETMTQPVLDDTTGAAVVPMVVTVPATSPGHDNLVQNGMKWIDMSRTVDEHLIVRAKDVLNRLLNGIDVPRHTVEGYVNARYATASLTDDSLYKQVIEPNTLDLVDGLTRVYLQPLLNADMAVEGWDPDEVEKIVVWYDPSEIMTRPDRGQDADAGFDRDVLSDDAWRGAHSFSATDAPSELELMERVLLKQSLPPNLVDYAMREVFPHYFKGAPPLVTTAQAGMATAPGSGSRVNGSKPAVSSQGTGSSTPEGSGAPRP